MESITFLAGTGWWEGNYSVWLSRNL